MVAAAFALCGEEFDVIYCAQTAVAAVYWLPVILCTQTHLLQSGLLNKTAAEQRNCNTRLHVLDFVVAFEIDGATTL